MTSERVLRLFVYLQRPDTGDWVTVGRYSLDAVAQRGSFLYAPSYMDAGLPWAIDPVNLPLRGASEIIAPRYRGLHDVLRDASPDAWGQAILRREKGLSEQAHPYQFLVNAKNGDRWGALAIGTTKTPSVSLLSQPRLHSLEALSRELVAMSRHEPPLDARLRKMLVGRPSLGGARPKGVVQDGRDYWLVKPRLPTDTTDVPQLEHATAVLGRAAGLDIAHTVRERFGDGLSVLRVKRFDRRGEHRLMAVSGASLLETEFPGTYRNEQWSYPRLAEQLLRIGAGVDRRELFFRMVFNALVGNDDDHPRNHAVIYDHEVGRWRLSPAFDIVPSWDEQPTGLMMQTSLGSFAISRQSMLADVHRFGVAPDEGAAVLDAFIQRVRDAMNGLDEGLAPSTRDFLAHRIEHGARSLLA